MPMTLLSSGRNNALDVDDVLMPSTPLAYPQVVSRSLASFGVVSRRQIQHFRSSRRFMRLVRFPAAPLRKALIGNNRSGPFRFPLVELCARKFRITTARRDVQGCAVE
jgi:hypothetical protein